MSVMFYSNGDGSKQTLSMISIIDVLPVKSSPSKVVVDSAWKQHSMRIKRDLREKIIPGKNLVRKTHKVWRVRPVLTIPTAGGGVYRNK